MKILQQIIIGTLLIVGCSNTTPPSIHSSKSIELQTIMHKFDNLIYQHFQSELDRDQKRINYTEDMILIVDDLIVNSKTLQTLPNQQSEGFLTLAKSLEEESKELKKIVLNYQTEEIAPTLDKINNICNKCHDNLQ